ncbi:MAG: hypothetical protein AAFZ80_07155 [Cyanobacteria bacterium P01_A01_bin.105]
MQNSSRQSRSDKAALETQRSNANPSRLYRRLEEALNTGSEVWFRMPGTRLVGIPIYLDTEYVEVVDVDVAEGFEDEDLPDEPYQRTVWLVRLSEISAISYATDRWSKDRFERLLDHHPDQGGHERVEPDPSDAEPEGSEQEGSEHQSREGS